MFFFTNHVSVERLHATVLNGRSENSSQLAEVRGDLLFRPEGQA